MKKNIYTYVFLFTILILFIGYFSFYQNTDAPNKNTVKIGMVTFPGYAPFYLAKEKQLFEGVDVELVRIESIGDLRAAMNSKRIDMYIATYDIFQSIEGSNPPGVGFLAIDQSNGADGLVVSKEISSLKDLKGVNVAAEPGFPPYFILQYMLHKSRLSMNDIQFKDLSSQDSATAFIARQVEVAGTYEPYLTKSVTMREDAKILVSSDDLPGLIVDVVFAREEMISTNPQILKKVSDGWFRAVNYYESNPEESMEVMSKHFGVSKEEMFDIKLGLKWLNVNDNYNLFDRNVEGNAYKTFDLVGDILKQNNPNNFSSKSDDKLSSEIIKLYSK